MSNVHAIGYRNHPSQFGPSRTYCCVKSQPQQSVQFVASVIPISLILTSRKFATGSSLDKGGYHGMKVCNSDYLKGGQKKKWQTRIRQKTPASHQCSSSILVLCTASPLNSSWADTGDPSRPLPCARFIPVQFFHRSTHIRISLNNALDFLPNPLAGLGTMLILQNKITKMHRGEIAVWSADWVRMVS